MVVKMGDHVHWVGVLNMNDEYVWHFAEHSEPNSKPQWHVIYLESRYKRTEQLGAAFFIPGIQ